MSDHENSKQPQLKPGQINIQVKDNASEIFFRIKATTKLEKIMNAFCERQGKDARTCRFVYDGDRVAKDQTPQEIGMEDGDILEVFQEQLGGA